MHGSPRPAEPEPQSAPKKGTGPRLDAVKAGAQAAAASPTVLASWRESDGHPAVVPARGRAARAPTASAWPREAGCPPGGRRAGVLAHSYEANLTGLRARQHTGWLDDGLYAPHTETGFAAPKNKTLLLLANGLLAKQGLRKARKEGRVPAGT